MGPSDLDRIVRRELHPFLVRTWREHREFFGLLPPVVRAHLINEHELGGPKRSVQAMLEGLPPGTSFVSVDEKAAIGRLLWAWYLFVPDEFTQTVSQLDTWTADRNLVLRALADLDVLQQLGQRELAILARRYLPEMSAPTLDEIGASYGLSRERVRQIIRDSLARIRGLLET